MNMEVPSELPKSEHFNIGFLDEHVAHVEINRANKLNSWHEAMWYDFERVIRLIGYNPNVRAIILSGSGPKAFTSGLDVAMAGANPTSPVNPNSGASDGARKAFLAHRHILDFQSAISQLELCQKPVAVVMHGYCFGLAIDIATACDVRFVTKDAKLCVKEVDIGLAADIGTLSRLPKVVGNFGWVKDVCLTARIFGAEEAWKVGLATRICDGKDDAFKQAVEWAKLVASKSPVATRGTKHLLDRARDLTTDEHLKYTAVWNGAMLQTGDVPEAMGAGLSKRKPRFEKL